MNGKAEKEEGKKSLEQQTEERGLDPWSEFGRRLGMFGRRGWLDPFNSDWFREMESIGPFGGKTPKVDMVDRKKEVVVRAELPGVSKDDVEITVNGQYVTIKAEKKHEEKKEEDRYYHYEMSHGEYQRTLYLPDEIDDSKAKTSFKDGVLELTLPKVKKTSERVIKVK
jgi:HSP20 family protein